MANNKSMSFDIDKDDYKTFIEDLRKELSSSTSHNIPVLMPDSAPLSWLDVRLISGNRTITLRIERRNMYVRGYSTNGTDFWEFNDSSLIPGSRPLQYSGGYAAANGLTNTAGVRRENLPVGYSPLQNAISNLAVIANPNLDQGQSARLLLTIVQMIAEAARMKLISEYIVQNWYNPTPITPRMVDLENAWRTFSSAVQRADTYWTASTPLPNVPSGNSINIFTVGQAIAALGILLYHRDSRNRVTRAVTQSSPNSNTSYIRTLVNIEYVRVNNIDDENPGDLYGTVIVKDCWGNHTVYDRSSSDPESIRPGDHASLTGPSTQISGDDACIISLSLWDHDAVSADDEIAKGDVVWDPRNQDSSSSYDKHLEAFVSGEHGSASVGYSIMREALNATNDVVLIDGDGESPADVYGTIIASRILGSSSMTRMLFDKSRDKYVPVKPQQSIPLTRPIFPVPVNSDLTITADLWDYDSLSPDDQIALGSVKFTPTVSTQKKIITGEHGKVEASVTFV